MNKYYKIPFLFKAITKPKYLPKVSLIESVQQYIFLILTTHFGECRYDPTFGCLVWEHDFELVYTLSSWQNRIADSIKKTLVKRETRLNEIQVKVTVEEEEWQQQATENNQLFKNIKKRINIGVSGKLNITNELIDFPDFVIYFSPVSLD